MKKTIRLAAFVLIAVFATVPLLAEGRENQRDDVILAEAVRQIQFHLYYTVYDNVDVAVDNGVVVLTGQVTSDYKKESYERSILKNVDGVKAVENRIEVLPASGTDSRLRYIIARNIFSDSRMLQYSLDPIPRSIHVIVKHGRVTLVGRVGSRLDSRVAEIRAREVFGVLSVTNNLVVD